jgi:hypothetical protein
VSGTKVTASQSSAGAQTVHRNAAAEDELMMKRVDISRAPEDEDELMTSRDRWMNSFEAGPAFERQLSQAGGGKPRRMMQVDVA